MKNKKELEYARKMLENELFAVVFPHGEKSEAAAQKLASQIDSVAGVAAFSDDDGRVSFGVLIDKVKEAKKILNTNPPKEENKE